MAVVYVVTTHETITVQVFRNNYFALILRYEVYYDKGHFVHLETSVMKSSEKEIIVLNDNYSK